MVNFWRVARVAALWLTTAMGGPALGAPSDSPKIVEIEVQGLTRVQEEAALSGTKIREGDPLDPGAVTEAIRAIWQTRLFRDVSASTRPGDGGVVLVFNVEEKPSIREVKYEGYDDLSKDDITKVVDLKPFTILDVDLITKNVEKIRDLYVQKGHYLADVTYRIDPVDPAPGQTATDQVDVVFVMHENAKVVVKSITIVGNEHLSDDAIKGVMVRTQEGNELSFLTRSGTFKEDFFQADLYMIQNLYFDHGFINANIGEPEVVISTDRRYIYITVPITEGKQYNLGEIRFGGDVRLEDDAGTVLVSEATLREKLRITPGEVFNRSKLLTDVQAITDVYKDHGYAYANVTPNSLTRGGALVVDLELEVERGDLVYFDRIEIVGNTRTRDKVIRRELNVYEGELYSATALAASKARVYQLGYFETVNVSASRGAQPNTMHVTVEVKEKSTGTFQVGAGYSTFQGFIATAQVSHNNFLGNGWQVGIQAQLAFGQFGQRTGSLSFYDPYFLDSMWRFGVNAYITQAFYRDFQRDATGISPTLRYPLTRELDIGVGYTFERINISTDFGGLVSSGSALANLNRSGWNSAFNLSLTYDSRDNRLFPTKGHFHTLMGEVSHPYIGTSEGLAYCRTQAFFRYYYPLPLSLVARANANFGYVFCGGELGVPISERFFPGGIYTVRGFQERGLGPTISTTNAGDPFSSTNEFIIGGNKQAILNLELEFDILAAAQIKGVVFFDMGNAYNDDQNFFYVDTDESLRAKAYKLGSNEPIDGGPPLGLYYSFGFGFRWFSPIGPLRFEWGIPITKRRPEDDNIVFAFTIGNFF